MSIDFARIFKRGEYANFSVEDKFWLFAGRGDAGECWNWTGSMYVATGYGRLWAKPFCWLAHRVSYELHFSDPDTLQVNHDCDNRLCVNPDHLYAGTQQDNIDDAFRRGRANPRGLWK